MKNALLVILLIGLLSCESREKIVYYATGEVECRAPLDEYGRYEGDVIRYYKNGKIKRVTPFRNRDINGIVKWYYPSGELEMKELLVNGINNGVVEYFYLNGKTKFKGIRRNNIWVDTLRSYHLNGEIKQIIVYNQAGKRIDFGAWLPNGRKDIRYTRPLVLSKFDSIDEGQDYIFEIQLGNRRSNVTSVKFLEPKARIDSTDGIYSDRQYTVRNPTPGKHTINAILYEQWARRGSDTIWTTTYPVSHSFYVIKRNGQRPGV